MIFILLFASKTSKITLKWKAWTLNTFMRQFWLMLLMSMFALTWWSPSVHIKTLSSRQPPLSYFFRPSRNKLKRLANTVITISSHFLRKRTFMICKQMSTKTSWLWAYSEAIFFALTANPSYINPTFNSFHCMLEFPS